MPAVWCKGVMGMHDAGQNTTDQLFSCNWFWAKVNLQVWQPIPNLIGDESILPFAPFHTIEVL